MASIKCPSPTGYCLVYSGDYVVVAVVGIYVCCYSNEMFGFGIWYWFCDIDSLCPS